MKNLTISILLLASANTFAGDYCKNAVPTQNLNAELMGKNLKCLDSLVTENSEKTIYLETIAGKNTSLVVVEAELENGTPTKINSIANVGDKALFPTSCGSYLMGARVLPGVSNIAVLYASDVIRVVNVKDGNAVVTIDHRPLHMGSTCMGYSANSEARRKEVLVNATANLVEINFSYYDFNQMTEVCTERPLQSYEIENLESDLESAKQNIVRRTRQIQEATNPSDLQDAQTQLGYAQKEVAALELQKLTGNARDCYGKAKQMFGSFIYKI